MLTADLVRATCRGNRVYPRYIDPSRADLVQVAQNLIDVFARAYASEPKWSRGQINESVDELVGMKADPLFFRGLRKLLEDRCTFATAARTDPIELRSRVFTLAAKTAMRRTPGSTWSEKREKLLRSVAEETGLTTHEISGSLFADLDARQRLVKLKPIEPTALLDRYNLGLAQAVLIRASRMKITLEGATAGAYRQVFRALKFHQLIHHIQTQEDGHTTIEIDGPFSLFSNAKRYGVAMARFLPTLVLTDAWRLEAELLWGKDKLARTFELDHRRGLRSHLKKRGQYVTSEQELFEERFAKKPGDWEMSRTAKVLKAKRGDVVIPDLQFRHGETGAKAYLEVIGFWRAGSLSARLEQLEDPSLQHLILAVSRKLSGDRGSSDLDHPRLVWFSQIISAAQVRDKLDAIASGGGLVGG